MLTYGTAKLHYAYHRYACIRSDQIQPFHSVLLAIPAPALGSHRCVDRSCCVNGVLRRRFTRRLYLGKSVAGRIFP